jgi:hypothetical protein
LTHSCKKILRLTQPLLHSQQLTLAKPFTQSVPLSGMQYKWTQRNRKLFPFTVAKAVNGVRMRFDTRRNAVGVILIEQKDPAAAIFETAGRANSNKLGSALVLLALVALDYWPSRV